MPKDFISVDQATKYGSHVISLRNSLKRVLDEAEFLKLTADHNVADPDYTQMDTMFGVGTGNGQTLYNVLASVYSQLSHTDIQTFIHRFG